METAETVITYSFLIVVVCVAILGIIVVVAGVNWVVRRIVK